MKNSNDFCFCLELKTNSEILLIREERVQVGASAGAEELDGLEGSRCSCGKPLLSPAKVLWGSSGRQAGSIILCRWF